MQDIVLGVDGGGTKTVAWLAPRVDPTNSVVLGRGQAGPGNPRSAGFETAQANIAAAVAAAFAAAGLPRAPAMAACFALAGAGRQSEQQRIAAWAREQGIAEAVSVTGDAQPILAAGSSENCGIALISGTGSLAWGRNSTGRVARCGGWGYLLGDEGSGYAIARAGLTAAMRSVDGRDQPTVLLDSFQTALSAATADDLVERIYSPDMTRDRLAALAPLVLNAATSDATAAQIVSHAVQELAALAQTLSRLLLLTDGFTLALGGSVLIHEQRFRDELLEQLNAKQRDIHAVLVPEPVRGAVALARAAAASA